MTLRIAPITMENIAYLGLPSARIMELMAAEIIIKEARLDDVTIIKRIGAENFCGAKQRQQGIDKNDKYNGQNNAYNYGQCNCVSHAFLGCLCLALAQFQAQIRCTAVANLMDSASAMIVMGKTMLVAPLPR